MRFGAKKSVAPVAKPNKAVHHPPETDFARASGPLVNQLLSLHGVIDNRATNQLLSLQEVIGNRAINLLLQTGGCQAEEGIVQAAPRRREMPPPKPRSKSQKLAERVRRLVLAKDATKLAVALRDCKDVKALERDYAHAFSEKGWNEHQLRDDIAAGFAPAVAAPLLSHLQSENPLPKKLTPQQAAKQKAEAAWSSAARELSRKRLQNPATWPPGFPQVKPVQTWGGWVLDNYEYLLSSTAPHRIGIHFGPPAPEELPRQMWDKERGGDIKVFAEIATQMVNAFQQLQNKVCTKGLAAGPWEFREQRLGYHCGCIAALGAWRKVFTETKGSAAEGMRRRVEETLKEIKEDEEQMKEKWGGKAVEELKKRYHGPCK